MSDDKLKRYLATLMPKDSEILDKDVAVVKQLVELTLQYRDELKTERNETLTVGETRVAIEIYWLALQKGHMPTRLEPKIEALVRLWLKEINRLTY
jgi:hypothetical protein